MKKKFLYLLGKLVVYLHYKKELDIYSLCSIHEPELYARANRKSKVPVSDRWKVWRRDNFTCRYCGSWAQYLTLDHVIPETEGGTNTQDNLVTACSSCNQKKGSKTYEEFVNSKWLIRKQKAIKKFPQSKPAQNV